MFQKDNIGVMEGGGTKSIFLNEIFHVNNYSGSSIYNQVKSLSVGA